jgi:hypothetical protein
MKRRPSTRRRNPANVITRDGVTLYVHKIARGAPSGYMSVAHYHADKAPTKPWAVYAVPAGGSIGHLWRQELGRFATQAEAKHCATTCQVPDFSEQLADLAVRQAKEARRRLRANPSKAKRNPNPRYTGHTKEQVERWTAPTPRQAQAAAEKLGPAATSRVVGSGGLSGASAAALIRLVKMAAAKKNPRRNPAPTPQMVTADDVWAWSVRLRPATPEVKRLAKAAGMPRGGDRKFWAGEMYGVLMDEHSGDNQLAYFLDHLDRFA